MDRKKFDDIKKYCEKEGINNLVGWAMWNEDENKLDDLSMFDEPNLKETLTRLKDDIVIMGLNPSSSANTREKTWAGFHNKHQGGRDFWLREMIKQIPVLEGAYMTDVFKFIESNAKIVKEEVKDDNKRRKQFDILEEELNLLGDILTIILIGNDAEKYFRMFEKEKMKIGNHHVYKIPHYSQYTKNERGTLIDTYIAEVQDKLKLELYVKHSTILGR